jgi:diguanylate cyclase (GGDEF)-like protein
MVAPVSASVGRFADGTLWRAVSFRSRLRLFFALIVIVPMVALAIVVFLLTERSETGKVDAGVAAGVRAAFGAHAEAADATAPALRDVASDPALHAALGSRRRVEQRLDELVRESQGVVSIEFRSPRGELIARSGSPRGLALSEAPLSLEGRRLGVLAVSTTDAPELLARVRRLTGLDLGVFRGGHLLASTVRGVGPRAELGSRGDPRDFRFGQAHFRGRIERVGEPVGPPVEILVLRDSTQLGERIARNRLVIGGLLVVFLLLALASAAFVGRALEAQIAKFLSAARRLGRGDFANPVPVEGDDEFAQLGREFNSMSGQLEAKIEEVERKRQELEETIRRVGDALATGLDRHGVVELAVRQAVDACEAQAGRAFPLDKHAFREARSGALDPGLEAAIGAAERKAFAATPETGRELLAQLDPDVPPPPPRRAVAGEAGGVHALAIPMRSLGGAGDREFLGVVSIARRARAFTREEGELLEYLAGQAVVSIENASLHETVERQAITDELTGLANVREFHAILERETERAHRFDNSLGLVMVDLDNFKRVNDEHGHQQGDEVLASVASVLRDFSRDIDTPARYGGEELAVVLPQTDTDGAALLAERMREAVEALRVPRVGRPGALRVTASFGVAALPESARDGEELVAAADAALYRAKRGGKNRVERAEQVAAAGPA